MLHEVITISSITLFVMSNGVNGLHHANTLYYILSAHKSLYVENNCVRVRQLIDPCAKLLDINNNRCNHKH